MKNKIQQIIAPSICIVAGILGFIFMGLDHMLSASSYGTYGIASGYDFIGFDVSSANAVALKVFDSIFLVIMIILPSVLIVAGIARILAVFLDNVTFFNKFAPIIKKICTIAIASYAITTVLSFIFVLIFSLVNGVGDYVSYRPAVGAYLLMCFALAEAAAVMVINNIFKELVGSPKLTYVCTSCGKTCRNGDRFCDACGSPVEPKTVYPTVYLCSACGHKASSKDRFCPVCGKPIIKQEAIPAVYICSACGATAKESSKFCPICGAPVVKKEVRANPFVCSACGKPATANDKFCSACGGAVVQKDGVFNVCSVCGKEAGQNDKFCSACGGTVIPK